MSDLLEQIKKAQSLLEQATVQVKEVVSQMESQEEPTEESPGVHYITDLEAGWDGKSILVTWRSNTDKQIDLQYRFKGRTSYISIQEMIHGDRFSPTPLSADMEEYRIGGVRNDDWEVLIVWGYWDYENKTFVAEDGTKPVSVNKRVEKEPEEPSVPKEPLKKKFIYHGLWDYKRQEVAKEFTNYSTIGKAMDRDVSGINMPAIMHLGLNQGREENRIKSVKDFDNGNTAILHFVDEPIAKGMDGRELDYWVDYAKDMYPGKYKYAYTLNSHELVNHNQNHPEDTYYPQKFDYVFHQCYPYRINDNWINIGDVNNRDNTTEKQLHDWLDNRLDILNERVPNSRYFIVGQSFYRDKGRGTGWRNPPVQAPFWYVKWAMQAEKVDGLLWWLYWKVKVDESLKNMDEYKRSIKEAFSLIPKENPQ